MRRKRPCRPRSGEHAAERGRDQGLRPDRWGAILRENGLRAIRTRAWKRTTVQEPQAKTAHIENHLLDDRGKRDFASTEPGTRLVGDVTYLRTGEGWLYLAAVVDLFPAW